MLLSGYFSLEFLFQARLIFGTKLNKLKKVFDEQNMSKFSVKKKFSKRNIFKIRILKVTKSKDRPITIKLNIIFTNVIVHFSQIDYFCPNTRLFGFTIDSTVFDFERVCMKKSSSYVHLMVTFTIKAFMDPQGQDSNRSSWPENLSSNQYS